MFLKTSGIRRNKAYGKKLWKKAGKAIKKRYVRKGGLGRLVKDVAMVKRMINSEKKFVNATRTFNVGQCNVNADSAWYATDITPLPSQGYTQTNRMGASFKVCSMVFRGQIQQMTGLNTDFKLKMFIIKTVGQTQTVDSTLVGKFLLPDALSTMTDYNSLRNPDQYHNFRIIKTKTIFLKNDSLSSQNQLKDFQINLRLNHHVRFDANSNTVIDQGQLWLLVVADTGNIDGSTASTLSNVYNKAVSTGATGLLHIRAYFYDN